MSLPSNWIICICVYALENMPGRQAQISQIVLGHFGHVAVLLCSTRAQHYNDPTEWAMQCEHTLRASFLLWRQPGEDANVVPPVPVRAAIMASILARYSGSFHLALMASLSFCRRCSLTNASSSAVLATFGFCTDRCISLAAELSKRHCIAACDTRMPFKQNSPST